MCRRKIGIKPDMERTSSEYGDSAMKVFKDYDFLAKHVRPNEEMPVHLKLALEIVGELDVKTILDIGGGSNSYVSLLSEAYDTAIVDMSHKSLEGVQAKEKKVGMLPKIPIARSFDFVSALEIAEHIDPLVYVDSLKEIARLSSRFVFLTSPFLQDLSSAFVLCKKCGVEFQAEGHWRSYGYKQIFGMQAYFGGVKQIYFIGTPRGRYFSYTVKTKVKHIVRRIMQKSIKKKYCHPPFSKCPSCGNETFIDYQTYYKKGRSTKGTKIYWKHGKSGVVSGQFGVLFDKSLFAKRGKKNGAISYDKKQNVG